VLVLEEGYSRWMLGIVGREGVVEGRRRRRARMLFVC
jgi:hypothetical protein